MLNTLQLVQHMWLCVLELLICHSRIFWLLDGRFGHRVFLLSMLGDAFSSFSRLQITLNFNNKNVIVLSVLQDPTNECNKRKRKCCVNVRKLTAFQRWILIYMWAMIPNLSVFLLELWKFSISQSQYHYCKAKSYCQYNQARSRSRISNVFSIVLHQRAAVVF